MELSLWVGWWKIVIWFYIVFFILHVLHSSLESDTLWLVAPHINQNHSLKEIKASTSGRGLSMGLNLNGDMMGVYVCLKGGRSISTLLNLVPVDTLVCQRRRKGRILGMPWPSTQSLLSLRLTAKLYSKGAGLDPVQATVAAFMHTLSNKWDGALEVRSCFTEILV